MAKTSMKIKQQRKPKFSTREYSRCRICGRPHAYLRKYGICRICFRELAYKGQIPGVKKASITQTPGEEKYVKCCLGAFRGQIEYKRRIHPHDYERSYCRYAYKNP